MSAPKLNIVLKQIEKSVGPQAKPPTYASTSEEIVSIETVPTSGEDIKEESKRKLTLFF
jgi:hypothetical protein